jgi:hypothetical protein
MGRQLRFYFLPDEEFEFLDYVLQRNPVEILKDMSSTPEFKITGDALLLSPDLHRVFFWNTNFNLSPNSMNQHTYQKFDETSGVYIKTDEIFYKFQFLNNPVIEYVRPFFRNDGKLTGGRIWADMYHLEGQKTVRNNPGFVSWYGDIVRWLKRKLKLDNEIKAYFSTRAIEWRNKGGELHIL